MQKLFDEWKVAYLAKGWRKITPREEELFNDFIQWSKWKAAEQGVHPTLGIRASFQAFIYAVKSSILTAFRRPPQRG